MIPYHFGGTVYTDNNNMSGYTHALSPLFGAVAVIPDLNEFISTEEAAEKLNYHVEHVRRMMREGSIEGVKIGRTWLVRRTALDRFMKRTAKMAKHDPSRNQERTPLKVFLSHAIQ